MGNYIRANEKQNRQFSGENHINPLLPLFLSLSLCCLSLSMSLSLFSLTISITLLSFILLSLSLIPYFLVSLFLSFSLFPFNSYFFPSLYIFLSSTDFSGVLVIQICVSKQRACEFPIQQEILSLIVDEYKSACYCLQQYSLFIS